MEYQGMKCKVEKLEYANGGTALVLEDPETGERIATASVYVGPLEKGEIGIKNYSENKGMLDWLVSQGIVSPPVRWIHSGFVEVPICLLKERDNGTEAI